jgi:hypothetical protein
MAWPSSLRLIIGAAAQGVEHISVVRSFFVQLVPLRRQFLLDLAFLAKTLAFLTLCKFFFLHFHHIVGC